MARVLSGIAAGFDQRKMDPDSETGNQGAIVKQCPNADRSVFGQKNSNKISKIFIRDNKNDEPLRDHSEISCSI